MSWPGFWSKSRKRGLAWQSKLLWPVGKWVCMIARRRYLAFRRSPPPRSSSAIVMVVGNVVVGGAGKTPFILWLAEILQQHQLRFGVVSRGYGGRSKHWPQRVYQDSDPLEVGDEPVLLAKHLNCPIAVSPKRTEAVAMLSEADDLEAPLDIIISDDGLQHFAMARDIEIALIDGQRGLGNELCMPAGPLREPKQRLKEVDFVVSNGQVCQDLNDAFRTKATVAEYETMRLMPVCFRNVAEPHRHLAADAFHGQSVNAMAGIGNPSRFYQTLKNLGMTLQTKDFADHQSYRPQDFEWVSAENETLPQKPLVMTEKDAVKCQAFAQENWWYLEVKPVCSPEFANRLLERINDLRSQVLNQQKVG